MCIVRVAWLLFIFVLKNENAQSVHVIEQDGDGKESVWGLSLIHI